MLDKIKLKIYCTFKYDWNLSGLSENIEFYTKKNEMQTKEEFLNEIKGCHGIICNARSFRIDAEVLNAAGNQLKVISTSTTGYDFIDVNECHKRNIKVGYLPDSFTG
jgi:lactate dehydrogenase-like 2-hydroxyacid dehydrogenase